MIRYLCILIELFGSSEGFNFDTRFPYIKSGPTGSNFGYAVESFKFRNGQEEIIVGAPNYSNENGDATGAIYQCPFSTSAMDIGECERISSLSADYKDSRYGQTLATAGDRLIACAPKFSEHLKRRKPSDEVESIIGSCDLYESGERFLQKIESNQLLEKPVDKLSHKANYNQRRDTFDYAKSQFGISVATSEQDILVGAGGTQAWSGSIVTAAIDGSSRTYAESPHCDARGSDRDSPRRWCKQVSQEVDSYGGSATAILTNVAGYPNEKIFAMGAPGDQKYGSVRFYRKHGFELVEIEELALTGRHQFKKALNMGYISTMGGLASSFGYAMTVIDLNGDGYDDLIVGAPQYYDAEENAGGAVFIFFSDGQVSGFKEFRMLTGPEGSSFGHSLASLGDANIDEYGDFCVGAPLTSHSSGNTGSIYMYNGQKKFSQIPTQVVTADDVDPVNRTDIIPVDGVTNFGLSLKGNIDLDNDGHPDLIVGARDMAIVLRARPIISISSDITITDSMNVVFDKIDLESENDICHEEGQAYHCFNVNVCFSFDKSTIKQLTGSRAINLTMVADSKLSENEKMTARARIGGWNTFSNKMTMTTNLEIASSGLKCLDPAKVFLNSNMKNKLTPVIISIDFSLANNEEIDAHSNKPVIRINGDKHVTKSVYIKNNCKRTNYCDDNLKIDNPGIAYKKNGEWVPLTSDSTLSADIEPRLKWTARVTNQGGEDAYNAGFTTKLPVFFKLNKSEIEPARDSFMCKEFTTMSHNYIKCDVDNPFRANSQATVSLYLDLIYNTLSKAKGGTIERWSHKTEHPELAENHEQLHRQARGPSIYSNSMYASANIVPFSFGEIVYESEVQIVTETNPSYIPVIYSPAESLKAKEISTFGDIGDKLIKSVIVKNLGKTPAKDIDVTIKVPNMIKDDHLLYLVSSKVMTKNERYECRIKNGAFNSDQLMYGNRRRRDNSDVGKDRGLGGVIYDSTLSMYIPKAHELGCRHEWVQCAEIICTIDNLGAQEIAHIEIESYVAQNALQRHFSGSQMFDVIWTGKVNSKWPMNGKIWSRNTLRIDQEVVTETNYAFYWSWWIIALICFGVFGIFMLLLVTLYFCGFFTRNNDIYRRC